MNERINKLFGQAMDQSIPETWTTLTHSQLSILKDKFAELIVKECISTVENLSPGYEDYRNQIEDAFRRDCVEQMKQHFGVEE